MNKRHSGVMLVVLMLWLMSIMQLTYQSGLGFFYYLPYFFYLLWQTRHQMKKWFKKVLVLEPFVFFMAASYLFFKREPLTLYGVTLTEGAFDALVLFFKSSLTLGAVLAFTNQSGIKRIAEGMYALKVPQVFILIFMQTYRFIDLLYDQGKQMMTAYRLRHAASPKGVDFSAWGSFPGQLLIRSLKQAEATQSAMQLRGYAYDHGYLEKRPLKKSDLFFFMGNALYLMVGLYYFR